MFPIRAGICNDHIAWVKKLAKRLREDGVNVKLDQWETVPGDNLPHFMEKSIRDNEYVLIICTPNYKLKSDYRKGAVGYEGDIMTGELLSQGNRRKFIPILALGASAAFVPTWLIGSYYIDMSTYDRHETGYNNLLTTIKNAREVAPPLGMVKDRRRLKQENLSEDELVEIRIQGVIVDEVTLPKGDGSYGSALYDVPFKLSVMPTAQWSKYFIQAWDHPPGGLSSRHRPGIARVVGRRIILSGTTIDEVEEVHMPALLGAVEHANQKMIAVNQQQRECDRHKREIEKMHKKNVEDVE